MCENRPISETHAPHDAPGGEISSSRRRFLGTTLMAGSAVALPLMAASESAKAAETSPMARGPIPAKGYAFSDYSGNLRPLNFKRRAMGASDVVIGIHFSGVCHSDIHTALGHWGDQLMPQITGHEIAGVVVAVGPDVRRFRVGDRVGVGPLVDACGECEECRSGNEQFCEVKIDFTFGTPTTEDKNPGGFTQGGYSNVIVVKENYIIRIPEGMDLASAGPIMCAGITMFSPLLRWNVRSGSRVGIVGLGGLGHIGVQLAKSLGAEVTVLTSSPDKVADAHRFGATDVIVDYDQAKLKKYYRHFDLIVDTVPYRHDMNPLMTTLKREATLCLLGIGKHTEPNQLTPTATILGGNAFAGSQFGSIRGTQDVVDYCAKHDIVPQVQKIALHDVSARWKEVIAKKVRYRYVIDMTSANPSMV